MQIFFLKRWTYKLAITSHISITLIQKNNIYVIYVLIYKKSFKLLN